ncbi:hypothetical protein CDQ84_05420 [Clostridium thermosuccinogenes]|jgi:LacI family transcriptional regulator|uniref:Transcriptional regulator LacI/GalR-like sensor domain-containing protein n=2 Tax=Clostridium thermosuccinogenes TaxID=84032 RepID=A0A2K2F1G9_9CLOT|nr:LacI family DNA-binding transcriptional regulator [Pseudoclostridium thermosuccinogenes]AUS96707.1 hypothetical protein CDO33_09815 [Pseudoclostridium thermosuccinogenes]PNT92631.1 hypothetical protein CDQ83_03445 [Pseudoclostridium thermosuccinogenes]PNT97631.1 hypothetical protein CDQ85_07595 [Pseudoclostridium thermosuccinogenes]PNU00524.1 hypothetical protein CDQ84_05420 [Pseudoclostridium thermosuccinogenes]
MKKTMLQQVADSLSLSRVTVWKVLNNRPGVAPETVQRVLAAIEKLQQENDSGTAGTQSLDPYIKNITLVAARANTSVFWTQIVDQIASELLLNKVRLNYLPIDVMKVPSSELSSILNADKTDGIIVINVYDEKFISTLSRISLPKVFLDTIPGFTVNDLNGDLVLLEGEKTVESITSNLIKKGCRRIGFIGDIHYAQTNAMRWKGFVNAMEHNGLPLESQLCFTKPIDKDSYLAEISTFLNGLKELPDAFVCVNDYVAFLVLNLLNDRRYNFSGNPILTGYDDSKDFLLDQHGITTVHVQNSILGKRMVNQLLFRIENPEADFEEITVMPKIVFRTANK